MRARVDFRPIEGGGFSGRPETEMYYAIRLYPETVEEVAGLEMAKDLHVTPRCMERIVNGDEIHYVVEFARGRR